MALAFANVIELKPNGVNNEVFGVVDITLDAAYPDAGWPIAASDLDLISLDLLVVPPTSAGGLVFRFDQPSGMLFCYEADGDVGALIKCASADNLCDGDIIRCFYTGT